MAITPNTTFTAGAVLTATQQNNFPRGIVAYAQVTTSDSTITADEIQVQSTSFTAVANRYYRITYYEPQFSTPAGSFAILSIKKTNLAGTVYNTGIAQSPAAGGLNYAINIQAVTTFSAGSTVVVGTAASGGGTCNATRSATSIAFILVEDIGPA